MTYTKRQAQENREMDALALKLFERNGFDVNKAGLNKYNQYDAYTKGHRDRVITQLMGDTTFLGVSERRIKNRVGRALRVLWGKRGEK